MRGTGARGETSGEVLRTIDSGLCSQGGRDSRFSHCVIRHLETHAETKIVGPSNAGGVQNRHFSNSASATELHIYLSHSYTKLRTASICHAAHNPGPQFQLAFWELGRNAEESSGVAGTVGALHGPEFTAIIHSKRRGRSYRSQRGANRHRRAHERCLDDTGAICLDPVPSRRCIDAAELLATRNPASRQAKGLPRRLH